VKRRLAALGTITALTASLSLAQPDPTEQADPAETVAGESPQISETEEGPPVAGSPAAGSPAAGSPAEDEPPIEVDTASEDSPFDYQASEQISEDLSVSFPVDIYSVCRPSLSFSCSPC
jgi:hypothetical protein